jgi:Lon-like ATP-dependent protease
LGKDKKWVNHAEEEGDDKVKEKEDKEDKVESEEGESSKSTIERSMEDSKSTIVAESESSSSSSSSPAAAGAAGSGSSSSSPPSSSSSDPPSPPKTGKEIAKPSIPEVYPQVLALPITRRPLFPGFYKAVTITSPSVIKAIRELLAHGQPYIGAFLLKDSNSDSDVITSIDQVHPVGVFAQITSVFGSTEVPAKEGEPSGEGKPETLTAVLYPHRRIRIDELITSAPPPSVESIPVVDVIEEVTKDETRDESEGEVASFEKEVPSVDEVKSEEQKCEYRLIYV